MRPADAIIKDTDGIRFKVVKTVYDQTYLKHDQSK